MKIEVTNAKLVNDKPVKKGDIVDVDRATARNLINKGFAIASDTEAKNLNLKTRSVVTHRMAKARIAKTIEDRKALLENQAENLAAELAA